MRTDSKNRKIELRPEWIIETYSISISADGDGEGCLYADSPSDASWIELALETLGVEFEYGEFFCDECETLHLEFSFDLRQIKEICPDMYQRMNEMDNHNHVLNLKKHLSC
jgi:hypothetical protein